MKADHSSSPTFESKTKGLSSRFSNVAIRVSSKGNNKFNTNATDNESLELKQRIICSKNTSPKQTFPDNLIGNQYVVSGTTS